MEEFLKALREFDQSFWGQLFLFIGGALFVGISVSWWFGQSSRRLRTTSLLGLLAAACWDIALFLKGQLLFGILLAIIILAGIAIIEMRRRRLSML
ncbi:MAG: hypothetical protein K6T71_00935 [Candidatus Bipolaricaulota bacterium]|nr:hypothetical protein [Candidatus Bipolaricaulota bacterium]